MKNSIVIITENKPDRNDFDNILAPYSEDFKAEPHVSSTYKEVKAYLRQVSLFMAEEPKSELLEALDKDDIGTIRYYNLKYQDEFNKFCDINKYGEGITDANPNVKWEYWRMGGKDIALFNGKNSIPLNEIPRAYPGDTEEVLKEKFPRMYDLWLEQKSFDKHFRKGIDQQNYPTFYDYICYRQPIAVVMPDGSWNEYTKYNLYDIEKRRETFGKFNRILDNLPENYYATLIEIQ